MEHVVARHVEAAPSSPAVEDVDGRRISYGELWAAAGRLAALLNEFGSNRGDLVAVALEPSIELVVAALGIARSGAAYVLLDPNSPPLRNGLIVDEVGAKVVVERSGQPAWSGSDGVRSITLPLPSTSAAPHEPSSAHEDPEDSLYIAYTSGSTGRPKGAVAPHRAVLHFVRDTRLCRLQRHDRVASLSSPSSDATTFELWKPLSAGASIVVLPKVLEVGLESWLDAIHDRGISVMFIMAGLLELVTRERPDAFRSLATVVFGGEAVHPDVVRRVCATAPPRRLVLGYGPTETTVFATCFECTTQSLSRRERIPLGHPLDSYVVDVLDTGLRPVPPGGVGELCIGGPAVARGYFAQKELTARSFVSRPGNTGEVIYRSGDLVRQLPDGMLEFVSRADRQIKLRGYRIELEEVERAVVATGLVHSAVVAKLDDPAPHLVCFYIPASGFAAVHDPAIELAADAATRLPGYMIPARWIAVSNMPRTTIGKIDRAALIEMCVTADRGSVNG
jgi:amino acid adenylation domain-containing protein